jgi:hypothetical protein
MTHSAKGHYISIKDLLAQVLPAAQIELPGESILEQVKIKPATIYPDPARGIRTETQVIIGHRFETPVPFMETLSLAVGGSETPIGLNYTLHPEVAVLLGPCAVTFYWDNEILIPVSRATDGQQRRVFEPDPQRDRFSMEIEECWLSYSEKEGIGFDSRLVLSIPPFMISGTDLVLSAEEAGIVFGPSIYTGVLTDLGFDDSFRGVFANHALLYWLPEIRLNGFDIPGLRLELENVAIGNQGISLDLSLSWEVAFTADGRILPDGTELLGELFDGHWQIALAGASGQIRQNRPEGIALAAYLRLPFFDAVFSARFALAYSVEDDGSTSYKTKITIAKESVDPVAAGFFDNNLTLTVNSFSASGWLSDDGFSLSGQTGFAFDIFGLNIDVQSATVAYTHLENRDDFKFTLSNVQLGELGTADQAKVIFKSHTNDQGDTIFDQIEASATYAWQDLKGLIPQEMQDILTLPDDGRIEALIAWKEADAPNSGTPKVEVRLLTEVSHLDNLWRFVPPRFRPEVRRLQSIFKITYNSAEAFNTKDAAGNALPPPHTYTERSGITVELSAAMEVKLPDPASFSSPHFDLIRVETGDDDGFVTAEFKADYRSDAYDGQSFKSGLTVQNPIALDVALPGTDPSAPFIHNALKKVGLQFAYADNSEEEMEIGGKLVFEGDFTFRPLVPADMPFAEHFNLLMQHVGLDEIIGHSSLSVAFTEDSFDLSIDGEFEDAGIDIDIFRLLSSLSPANERPDSEAVEIDFQFGFHLIGFSFNIGTDGDAGGSDSGLYFEFNLKVECTMTGLPPLLAAITLSGDEFSFGLEELTIPLEVPRYPIDNNDLAQLAGSDGTWSAAAQQSYEEQLEGQIDLVDQQLTAGELTPRDEFRLIKDKSHLELKKLLLQLVMAVHRQVGPGGRATYQGLIEIDTWMHATFLNLLHLDTELKLNFPEIKFKIPFQDPGGIALSGTGRVVGFADGDPFKSLEDYTFSVGLSAEYIFCKIESTGDPIPIPGFGTKYDDGSISISKFMIGYGYTKNSFAMDFAGEAIIPTELIRDADTSESLGAGIRLPRHNKLAFKIDLIPVSIGKATVIIPLPQFDLDLRTPNAPAMGSTRTCEPFWDGFEVHLRNGIRADLKRTAFSPFFGFSIAPNFKFDGDIQLGNDTNGLTLVIDDMLLITGVYAGTSLPVTPIPFFADPTQPYFRNICANLRVLGFEINFNMQRPFPSFSPMALFEVFGLLSNPMMEIDPNGSLANTIRFTLSDAYVQVPDFVVQMFPDAANFVHRRYGFTLNLGTLITMAQSIAKIAGPAMDAANRFINAPSANVESLLNSIPNTLNPWDWIALLPPELRKFRTGGQIAGFEASACLVMATGDEARQALKNSKAPKANLPALAVDRHADRKLVTYTKTPETLLTATDESPLSANWTKEGVAAGRWEKTGEGIFQGENVNGIAYLLHNSTAIPSHITARVTIRHTVQHDPSAAGIVFCYADTKNHYLLRTLTTDSQAAGPEGGGMVQRSVVVERKKNNVIHKLAEKVLVTPRTDAIQLELTTYMDEGRRTFIVSRITTVRMRGSGQTNAFAEKLFEVQEDQAMDHGRVGLYAKNQSVWFSAMTVHPLAVEKAGFGQISDSSMQSGFNVNLPASQMGGRRFIGQNETLTLFKGIEFQKFNEDHLDRIPVGRLSHIADVDAGIYIGAYIKVFARQRLRFLGRIFSDGSFALVSEAESKPLNITVLGIPVHLPFSGYGNLVAVGRQKRNGYYGYIEANGTFDWSPIPNIVRLRIGDRSRPAMLRLRSNGQFELNASASVHLFNGTATIEEASVIITQQRAAFKGRLRFNLGANIAGYRFTDILALDISGSGAIESADRFQFQGRGDVRFLGESFTSVKVDVNEQYAYFAIRFKKPRSSDSALESKFPILASCEIDLRGSCKFKMQRTVRPEFRLAGEGHIKVLGAEITGKGEISSIPKKNNSLKKDLFYASMEGNLSWQGRKWLGGKISVGSHGLRISGTTHLGLQLTPAQVGPIRIAKLFLNIQLEGRLVLDADKPGLYFLFRGHWTLGAAMADTGNARNRQVLPLASSQFVFSSGATTGDPDQYRLPLFHIDGFAFMPFKEATVPVPTVTLTNKTGAITLVKSGTTDTDPPDAAVEFYTPLSNVGIKTSFPYAYVDAQNFKPAGLRKLYSAYDVNFGVDQLTVDFDNLSDIDIFLCLDNDFDQNFPLRIVVESSGGAGDFS